MECIASLVFVLYKGPHIGGVVARCESECEVMAEVLPGAGWLMFGAVWVPKRMPKGDETCALPSGKRLHNYGKSPFLMGKSMKIHYKWPFSIALVYQRVPGCDER